MVKGSGLYGLSDVLIMEIFAGGFPPALSLATHFFMIDGIKPKFF
jgi:hypothetical protein